MFLESIVRYVHFISLFLLAASVLGEWWLIRPQHSRKEIQQLSRFDAVYGISVLIAIAAGFTLWFVVGKPAAYYTNNSIFLLKVGLAVLLGILSAYPSIHFARHKKGNEEDNISTPKLVIHMIRAEAILIFIIPFLATLMARGFGS
jgi:putative membrane protein